MKDTVKFDAPRIGDYILAMGETIDMFSHFNIPIHIQIQKIGSWSPARIFPRYGHKS
jgi:hypothetical protein